MAPTTAYAVTLDGTNNTPGEPDPQVLITAANAGHSDLIARGRLQGTPVGMLYNPVTGLFEVDATGSGPFSLNDLQTLVAAADTDLTLIGTPVKMGYRLGLDREMDFLLDGDELILGTFNYSADSDLDGFPDGYEQAHSSNSNCASDRSCLPDVETDAPTVVGTATVRWTNSNVAKIEWETNEESRSILRVKTSPGASTPVWSGEESQFKKQHVMVARGLLPGQTMTLEIETEDPASSPNTHTQTLFLTPQGRLFQSVHVEETRLDVGSQNGDGTYPLTATFKIVDAAGSPVSGADVKFWVVEWPKPNG